MRSIFNNIGKSKNEEAIGRFILAMVKNDYLNWNIDESGIKNAAGFFFDHLEDKEGITLTKDEYIELTTKILIRKKHEHNQTKH